VKKLCSLYEGTPQTGCQRYITTKFSISMNHKICFENFEDVRQRRLVNQHEFLLSKKELVT
jgi:hypothetical protein